MSRWRTLSLTVAVASFLLGAALPFSAADPQPSTSDCQRASVELFGVTPVRFGGSGPKSAVSEPKRLRDAKPQLPAQWPKNCRGTVTLHEALIGPSGKVERVWTLKSPCTEIDKPIAGALRQWEYAPTVVDGAQVPVCMMVSTLVHLR